MTGLCPRCSLPLPATTVHAGPQMCIRDLIVLVNRLQATLNALGAGAVERIFYERERAARIALSIGLDYARRRQNEIDRWCASSVVEEVAQLASLVILGDMLPGGVAAYAGDDAAQKQVPVTEEIRPPEIKVSLAVNPDGTAAERQREGILLPGQAEFEQARSKRLL